jgi:hypothetical protein
MKISSFYKQVIRTVQFSLAALICSVALNFGTAAPSLAAQIQLPTSNLAIFGWGEKAEGKAEQLVGKAQSKTGNKLEGTGKQVKGRADYDLGRVEDASRRTADKAGKMAKDIKKGIDKNLSQAGNSLVAGSSSVTKGVEQLPKIDDAAAQVAERSAPMGLEEIEARNKGGLNEIQGAEDANKMHKADTSKPGPAISKKVEKAFDKISK